MAGDVTISWVGDARPWKTAQGGQFVSYKVTLQELEGIHELTQKPETPAPTVGQKFLGEVHPPNREGFPPKIKKVQQNFGGGNRGSSPDERRSIERQVSAKIAAELVIGGKGELKDFRLLTDRVHAAIQGAE